MTRAALALTLALALSACTVPGLIGGGLAISAVGVGASIYQHQQAPRSEIARPIECPGGVAMEQRDWVGPRERLPVLRKDACGGTP